MCKIDSHFYPSTVLEVSPPDIYGILVDKERGNRPHIFSREEVLREAVSPPLVPPPRPDNFFFGTFLPFMKKSDIFSIL